jgi:putative thioredoxin
MDVTAANFETEVLLASQSVPVLVDFWAPWCAPCKSLGPILEKLEVAYGGRFKLCKINSDDEQQLAAAFGIRSLPTCVLLVNGQPVDGFMGALPEGQVRAFLDKHLGADDGQDAAEDALEEPLDDNPADRLQHLAEKLAQDPQNNDLRFDYCKHLIAEGLYEEAQTALAPALAQIPMQLRFDGLNRWLQALVFVDSDPRGQWSVAQFDEHIAQNKRDFDTRYTKAQLLMASGQWPEAMDELLEIIMRDKAWNDEAPRKMMVGMLELMTPPAPKPQAGAPADKGGIQIAGATAVQQDPQMELISRYRRKLSMALN